MPSGVNLNLSCSVANARGKDSQGLRGSDRVRTVRKSEKYDPVCARGVFPRTRDRGSGVGLGDLDRYFLEKVNPLLFFPIQRYLALDLFVIKSNPCGKE